MVASAKGVTEGVVYRLVDPVQIEMMDPYEGYPVLYRRTALPIVTKAGVVDAWVYIANEDHVAEGLAPAQWYLNHLLAGRELSFSILFRVSFTDKVFSMIQTLSLLDAR